MTKSKYFEAVEAAIDRYAQYPDGDLPPFDFNRLAAKNWFAAQKSKLAQAALKPIYRFGRAFKPIITLAGMTHIVRDREVRQVLERTEDFQVPFGPEMQELAGGSTFVLGLEGSAHERQNAIIHKIVRREDTAFIAETSQRFSRELIENSAGRIDAIDDYFKRIAAEVCIRYFGFSTSDTDAFADWTISSSAILFADPYGDPEIRDLALNGSVRIRAVINDTIARMRRQIDQYGLPPEGPQTLIERLLILQDEQRDSDPISNSEIRSILYGLVAGFIPTNTLAAAKILEELCRRPGAMKEAKQVARRGEREKLKRILLEAGRLNPALAPGQWRYVPKDTEIDIDGRSQKIKAGSLLMVSTMSAMRDRRAMPEPNRFLPDRKDADGKWIEPDLIFGMGAHVCIGKYLAIEQITETMMALLGAKNVKPAPGKAGRLKTVGPFPRHLEMVYDSSASQQSMFIVLADANDGLDKQTIDAEIARLKNPADQTVRKALDETGILHFSSLSTIETEKGIKIAFELSVDGDPVEALAKISSCAGEYFLRIFGMAGLREDQQLSDFMQAHMVNLHGKPWGATGVDYNGLGEFPVQKVEKQMRFADFADRVLRNYVKTETARGSHPTLILSHLRRILRSDPILKAEATPEQLALMAEARQESFDAFSFVTNKMRLRLTKYQEKTHFQKAIAFFQSRDAMPFWLGLLALSAICGFVFWPSFGGAAFSKISLVVLSALLMAVTIVFLTLVGLTAIVRMHEKREKAYEEDAPLSKLREIVASENPPGYQQNHVMAVGRLKAGLFRKLLHAFSLWSIRMSIIHWFRPGLINHMGTIHYARWWCVPGTQTVSFYSNFDGSWESYLEDFIMRNRWGQAAAWSNWEGFPETKFLIFGGAGDAGGFKRWVRVVQQIAPFWYSRFPELTTERIRNNGIIQIGAGLAESATEAEEWLRCFSSMPRTENRIETDEVQALVFRGMKRLPYSTCLTVKLPDMAGDLGEWLYWLRGKPMKAQGLVGEGNEAAVKLLVDEGILVSVPRPEGKDSEYALSHAMTIAFGDRPLDGGNGAFENPEEDHNRDAQAAMAQAVILGLSASGIAKFEAPNSKEDALFSEFPSPFRMGMSGRSRILGDQGVNATENWRWHDGSDGKKAVEAVLMLYAADRDALARMEQVHRALLENHGGKLVSQIQCAPAWSDPEKADFEHFGFRDGISQPVIKGSSRATKGVPERDLAEPGEFILGYRDSMGYFPASPKLPKEADMASALPVVVNGNLSKYPDFGNPGLSDVPRDFGRNGTFLVIRELKQDVDAFENFADQAASELGKGGLKDLYKIVGQLPDREWVKAKLMGRWTTGRPLIGNPVFNPAHTDNLLAETENDFSYGEDDPHGLACPFGSHIRRTNPRDSRLPGNKGALDISNRHRILRRGRPYTSMENDEKGLLFACFCTDIERQFEFVQQFWSNASSFHGLADEPDPIIGASSHDPDTSEEKRRVFSIPTAAGPVRLEGLKNFVQVMGGGYFFVPSRSALSWLSETALHSEPTDVGARP